MLADMDGLPMLRRRVVGCNVGYAGVAWQGDSGMAEDWAVDVRRYAPDADEGVIAGIVRHCGIALRSRDASLVSFGDPAELAVVRESFCRKKLGLTDSDAVLDAAIFRVGERMQADTTKNRVTVYYLLAEHFGKLGLFGGAAAGTARVAAEPVPVAAAPVAAAPVIPVVPAMAAAAVAPVMAAAAPAKASAPAPAPAKAAKPDDGDIVTVGASTLGLLGLGIVAAAVGALLITNRASPPEVPALVPNLPAGASTTGTAMTPATGAAGVAVPDGAGVVAAEVAGRPQLSVYFDTASTDVTPDFAAAAASIKAWMDSHPGDRLAVSGYNDPRGDAAFNAELSKNRAERVAAALAAIGVAAGAIDLEKPPETTDADNTLENARRVDIVVKGS